MSVMRGCEGGGSVVRSGNLRKLKTSRRKYFVLRAESTEASARLEYYDSEKKYHNGVAPKRSIPLKSCFNINRRLDTKHKHVIALYTKDDCFCIVLDSEEDVDSWLKALLSLQHGEEVVDGETPKPTFEHVWQVTVLNRGLGTAGLTGNYRLCLTDKTLSLIKRDCEVPQIELNLTNIRSCGNLRDFFFLEIGRSSTLGAGELWMQTEDNNIAQNVHSTVFHAMSTNSNKDELGPKSRIRSSSATESSKPMGRNPKNRILPQVSGVASFYQHLIQRGTSKASERRHSISAGSLTPSGTISHQRTQSLPLANPISDQSTSHRAKRPTNQSSKCMSGGRERCDSMPSSRIRTTSEGNPMWTRPHLNHYRPPSFYGRGGEHSHSPPSGSPVSPPSMGCSTDSAASSYNSLTDETDGCGEMETNVGRYPLPLTPDEAIVEEEYPDSPYVTYVPMTLPSSDDGYVDMSPKGPHHNSPTASLSSVTSGTPSTDMRFVEYPLEKVTSYFTPSEEDDTRPTRAYSVGSRPESSKKYQETFPITNENLRVRALSVGSKTKRGPGRVLPPSHGYHPPQHNKSSSAPILSNGRSQGSHNSIGPMDDLMEMDFSRSSSGANSGYMVMTPGTKSGGYVEMRPGNGKKVEASPYVDMTTGGSSPAKPSYISPPTDYVEMDPRKASNNLLINVNNNGDYLAMSFSKADRHHSNYQLSPAKTSLMYVSPIGSPKTEPPTPEGYVEMSLGRGHQRQSSLDSAQIVNDDYANMSMGKKRDRGTPRKKEKTRSQPIAIQNPSGNLPVSGNASSPRYALLARKYSTGTPPTMHLPLSTEATPYASLPRRKNSHRDSKDSSSSSLTTPSSSSTIFPFSLNSPCSPETPKMVPPKKQSKTDNDDYTPMDFCRTDESAYVNFDPAIMKPTNQLAGMQLSDSSRFQPIDENRSRPSSTSSELTVVGSRPPSVTSADKQLHYASLDLVDEGSKSPRGGKGEGGETMTYAAIDFVRSEGLKHNSMATNAKVKH